jgi:hypothetical protein
VVYVESRHGHFGAIRLSAQVLVEERWKFAAGAESRIDRALGVAAMLHGEEAAQTIQSDRVCGSARARPHSN